MKADKIPQIKISVIYTADINNLPPRPLEQLKSLHLLSPKFDKEGKDAGVELGGALLFQFSEDMWSLSLSNDKVTPVFDSGVRTMMQR